jgi:hypothetical protein
MSPQQPVTHVIVYTPAFSATVFAVGGLIVNV